jgi:beta-lactam-binding protein with PASTA domain
VVVEQRPGSGTQLDKGAEVVIVIGVLEEPPAEVPPAEPEVP